MVDTSPTRAETRLVLTDVSSCDVQKFVKYDVGKRFGSNHDQADSPMMLTPASRDLLNDGYYG